MRFKLDENTPPTLKKIILVHGNHDVHTVAEEHLRRTTDHVLARTCKAEKRVLVTLDKDFTKPLLHPTSSFFGAIILHVDFPSMKETERIFKKFLDVYPIEHLPGKVITVEENRYAIRE